MESSSEIRGESPANFCPRNISQNRLLLSDWCFQLICNLLTVIIEVIVHIMKVFRLHDMKAYAEKEI